MQTLDSMQGMNADVIQARKSAAGYWGLISTEMNVLYLLSFLLTADKEKAEKCLDQALEEFVEGVEDFVVWAQTRGRDAVLDCAIRLVNPDPGATPDEMDFCDLPPFPAGNHVFSTIAGLPAFERFAFAMTRIYGKSDSECAKLLSAARQEVTIARELTEQIVAANIEETPAHPPKHCAHSDGAYLFDPRCTSC